MSVLLRTLPMETSMILLDGCIFCKLIKFRSNSITGILPGTLPMYSIFWGTLPAVLYQEFLPSGSDVRRFLCSVRNKPTPQILLFCKEQTMIPLPKFLCEPKCCHDPLCEPTWSHNPYPSRSHDPSVSTWAYMFSWSLSKFSWTET